MLDMLRRVGDQIMGRGEASITVPAFDGALKPNKLLDAAEAVLPCDAASDLAGNGAGLLLADGPSLKLFSLDATTEIRRFDEPITALATLKDGGLAVALNGREVHLFDGPQTGAPRQVYSGAGMACVNALSCDSAGGVYATDGSAKYMPGDWVWDLMGHGKTGRLLHLSGGQITLRQSGLRYGFGVTCDGGDLLLSESWAHRLLRVTTSGHETALGRLPVYPSRLAPAKGGGWWLTAFIARTQLVEFVLREPAFRKRMMAELDPDHWIAPRLRTGQSVMEPMQGAHLKTMGVNKPWAPPRSYGLIIRLDAQARPIASAHSRVDGTVHGIAACAEMGEHLYFIAAGPKQLMRIPLAQLKGASQ